MAENNLLNNALLTVSKALEPLKEVTNETKASELMANLGYELPGSATFTGIPATVISKAAALTDAIAELENIGVSEDALFIVLGLTSDVAALCASIAAMPSEMQTAGQASANFFNNARINELPRRLLDYVVSVYLDTHQPKAYHILQVIGFIEEKALPANAAIFQPVTTLKIVWWERLPMYITQPLDLSEQIYQWQSNFNSDLILQKLENLLIRLGLPQRISDQLASVRAALGNVAATTKEIILPVLQELNIPGSPDEFGVNISGVDAAGGKPKGLAIMPYANGNATIPFSISTDYEVVLEIKSSIDDGLGIILRPPFDLEFINNLFTAPGSVGDFHIKVCLKKKAGQDDTTYIFGSANSSSLSIQGIEFCIFFTKKPNELDFGFDFEIQKGKVVVGVENGDGFIEKILSGIHVEMEFDLGIGFTKKNGFAFRGSGGLELAIPLHLNLGPLNINNLLLKLLPEDGKFPFVAATTFNIALGPMQAVIENIGVKLTLSFPNGGGNLGPANFDLGFQPPNGVGLTINAGAVIGGGYLFFDFEKEEYAGALELSIAGFISAKAIGIITTKMPDGSKGFSLLIIITAEFNPAFQLGMGFTLNGVGGLVGLNRTMLLDPLREAVRTGAVTSIMFPQNVVANAARIISDLKAIFPPYEGKFLIGPMAKLGWGTPTLISLSLGVIIEIPGNIAILGILKIALPDERIPLVQIQVLFVGTIDFDKKMLTFDASIFDSFILFMTLEGDMAVRLKWGDDPAFLVSIGGFHPAFVPPPLALPTLRRLSITILNNSIAKIRVECYQAVTSNTVQFGVKADINLDLKACGVKGDIGFDALFQFSPFYFIISLSANFKLSAIGIDLMTVRVKMSLEGPTPWRAKGTGKVSLLFFDISANFDITWGDPKNTALPGIDILPPFLEELQKQDNWSAQLDSAKTLLITLRKMKEEETALVLHPSGSLTVQQKFLPLKIEFSKVGSNAVEDIQKVAISAVTVNAVKLPFVDVKEHFARAQYQVLKDAEKLSTPSFEQMPGGVKIEVGTDDFTNGKMVRKDVAYEVTIIDKEPFKPFRKGFLYKTSGLLFSHFLKGSSTYQSVLSKAYKEKLQPFDEKVKVSQEGYTVAFLDTNKAINATASFDSEIEATQYFNTQLQGDANLVQDIHIIPNYELQEL